MCTLLFIDFNQAWFGCETTEFHSFFEFDRAALKRHYISLYNLYYVRKNKEIKEVFHDGHDVKSEKAVTVQNFFHHLFYFSCKNYSCRWPSANIVIV